MCMSPVTRTHFRHETRIALQPSAVAAERKATCNGHHSPTNLGTHPEQSQDKTEASLITLVPLLVVGDSGAGKTSFVHHYLNGLWPETRGATVGADLYIQRLVVKQQLTVLQIWDVGSDEQAELLDNDFYGNAAAAVIVCNLDSTECLTGLQHWQHKLCQVSLDLPIVVLANTFRPSVHDAVTLHRTQVHQDVIRWCHSNNVCLNVQAGWRDHQSSVAAIDDLIHRALAYVKHKPKPKRKSFSSQAYPELSLLLNANE